jgi:hypothetical protein
MALTVLLLMLAMGVCFMRPAYAQESSGKVVRVGWYDSSYNTMDNRGRRSGYAYEYQQKIAAFKQEMAEA